ncbi:MAG: hypothetical protein LBR10_03065 [Prevotellaceae bacterium]|jgi:hypothetical protein|nr:hypothetical protein [Prevotellaceae bacterium]
MASIYDLDDVGFIGGPPITEEDRLFFRTYFQGLRTKRAEEVKKAAAMQKPLNPTSTNNRIVSER